MAEIRVGSSVRLKSGGPTMTVEQLGTTQLGGEVVHAWCQWFDKTKLTTGVFPVTSLEALD